MKDQGILIILTMPEINKEHLFSKDHLEKREIFYNTDNPIWIKRDHMVATYEKFANQYGFILKDWFYVDRWFMYYLTKWFRTKRLCFLVLTLEK